MAFSVVLNIDVGLAHTKVMKSEAGSFTSIEQGWQSKKYLAEMQESGDIFFDFNAVCNVIKL